VKVLPPFGEPSPRQGVNFSLAAMSRIARGGCATMARVKKQRLD